MAASCGGRIVMSLPSKDVMFCVFTFVLQIIIVSSANTPSDDFSERLLIKPLADGRLYAFFQFTTKWNIDIAKWDTNFRLFPRSLGEITSRHRVQELHLRLTQGLWRYKQWGFPVISTSPGAELWVWFQNNTKDPRTTWKELTNALSGQFCASLNFIEDSNTAQPKLSFRPDGVLPEGSLLNSSHLFYAVLPKESVCTENLTPWKKLLPCDTKAGLSTLLNAIPMLNSNYFSLAVDIIPICQDSKCTKKAVQLQESASIVFNPVNSQDGKQDWNFVSLFGTILKSHCPVASKSEIFVDFATNQSGIPFTLTPAPTRTIPQDSKDLLKNHAVYDVKEHLTQEPSLNIRATYGKKHMFWVVPPPPIHASRYVKGYGLGSGGIKCRIINNEPTPVKIIYFETIPWFLKMYLHTLKITHTDKEMIPEYQFYHPGKDRERPHHMELVFTLPPKSTVEVSFEFDRAFLKWTEYPPDANHGFYVGPAVISTLLSTDRNLTKFDFCEHCRWQGMDKHFMRLHTETLLVSLPTPDFSMPYNVICLVCTVIALAFGPIHNVTTKRLHLVTEQGGNLLDNIKKLFVKPRTERKQPDEKGDASDN